MDELVAKELGRLTMAVIKQGALIEALRTELAKRDATIAQLTANEPELPLPKSGVNGHAAAN